MKYIVIRPHSFVDVITNSSSELFIVGGDKDIEVVKKTLEDIFIGDYKYAIASVTKIHNEDEAYAVMFDMIDDLTKFLEPYEFENTTRGKIISKLEEKGISNWDVEHKEYCKLAAPILKEMIENNEVDFEGPERILKPGDIVICGNENSIFGDDAEKIRNAFGAVQFFGSPI